MGFIYESSLLPSSPPFRLRVACACNSAQHGHVGRFHICSLKVSNESSRLCRGPIGSCLVFIVWKAWICSVVLSSAAPVKIPSNQDGCSSAESWNDLGHARVLNIPAICCCSGSHLLLQTKQHNGTKPIKCTYFTFLGFFSPSLLSYAVRVLDSSSLFLSSCLYYLKHGLHSKCLCFI